MKERLKLQGVLTAVVTPFKPSGEIDWRQFHRDLEFQIGQGVTGIVPTGTTGESPTLSWQEHIGLIRGAIKTVEAAVPETFVLAGTGSNSTGEALRASVEAVNEGADGVLLVECYYNKPSSSQLRERYHTPIAKAVAQVNPKAVVVPYIIPGRTNCKMEPIDLLILAHQCPNVRAVKEATGDLQNMVLTRHLLGLGFSILSGDDSLTAEMMRIGEILGDGVISVVSNIAPAAIVKMVKIFLEGDYELGLKLADQLKPLFELVGVSVSSKRQFDSRNYPVVDKFPNPCSVKTMMAGLGMDSGFLRSPLGPMNPAAVQRVRSALQQVWRDNPEILQPIEEFYGGRIKHRLADDKLWQTLSQ